jgi:hypothetical protein
MSKVWFIPVSDIDYIRLYFESHLHCLLWRAIGTHDGQKHWHFAVTRERIDVEFDVWICSCVLICDWDLSFPISLLFKVEEYVARIKS